MREVKRHQTVLRYVRIMLVTLKETTNIGNMKLSLFSINQ